jgi:DNA repair photolyase
MASAEPAQTDDTLDGKRIHPLASLFPPMSGDEFAAVCEDVKANGLVEPIVVLNGEILDGVHRLRACLQTGIEPRYQEWNGEGGTPMQYVWSRNWTRRHLTAGQRAVISLAAEKELAKEAALRMSPKARAEGVERFPQVVDETGRARDQAGRLGGVSGRYVQDAKLVEQSSLELLRLVWRGALTLPAAKRQTRLLAGEPANDARTHRVHLVFADHSLKSQRLSKAEAAALRKALAKSLAGTGAKVQVVDARAAAAKKPVKPAFGTKEWADETVNILSGCQHDCVYCYAKADAIRRHQNRADTWNTPVVNPDGVSRGLQKRGSLLMFPSTHDVHPDNLEDYLTVLRQLLSAHNKVLVVSKPHRECIERLCRELKEFKALILFRFTIGSADDAVLRLWEPNAPSFAERVACLEYAYREGFQTSVSCEPMLDDKVDAVIEKVKPYVTDVIWLGRANLLKKRVEANRPGDESFSERAEVLEALMSDEYVRALHARLEDDTKIEWKESITKVLKRR